MNRLLVFSLILLGASSVSAAEPQEILFLSDRGPILIELQVTVDGKPYDKPWHEFVQQLFDGLDSDHDGVLQAAEAQKIPSTEQLGQLGLSVRASSSPPTGSVDRKAFAAYLEKATGGPFAMNKQSTPTQARRVYYPNGAPNSKVDIFPKLDRNSDEKLGPGDFDLTNQLRKLDINDDENIARAELAPATSPYYFAPSMRGGQPAVAQKTPFLHLADPELNSVAVVRQLIAKYDTGNKDSALTRSELGMSEKTFARRDVDANGQLDFDEIRQWLRAGQPNLNVTVRLGKDGNKKAIEVKTSEDAEFDGKLRNGGTSPQLAVGKVQVEFGTPPPQGFGLNVEDQYRMLHGQFDQDNNGYLDKDEMQRTTFRASFEFIDRDGDEKVFLKELLAFAKQMTQGSESRIVLKVDDRGNQLFQILDLNRDQRLNRRELRAGRDRIAEWDEDGDQKITVAEVPRNWHLTVSRGSANLGAYAFAVVASTPGSPNGGRPSTSKPAWFHKMDSNRDGDLSRREFLGRREDFDRIDANSDDVIDRDEAKTVLGE